MANNKSTLSQILDLIEKEHPEGLTPAQFVDVALKQWASMDLFFRGFDKNVMDSVTKGLTNEFAIFQREGTDHYFGLPLSGTTLMDRLGIYRDPHFSGYGPQIRAILMRELHRNGYEFFGVRQAPIAYANRDASVLPTHLTSPFFPLSSKGVEIQSSRLDKILKTTHYIGYQMTEEFKGALLLIPKNLLIQSEAV